MQQGPGLVTWRLLDPFVPHLFTLPSTCRFIRCIGQWGRRLRDMDGRRFIRHGWLHVGRTHAHKGYLKPTTPADPPCTLTVAGDDTTSISASRGNSRARNHSLRPDVVRRPRFMTVRASTITLRQTGFHSTLREFFNPLRTNGSRVNFFNVYRK